MTDINSSVRRIAADATRDHSGLIYRVGRLWELAKDYWDIVRPMRFCVLVWAGITLLIVFIPQSQDALLALLEDAFVGSFSDSAPGIANLIAFSLLAFFWAFQTFYWARFVSRLPARSRRASCYPPPILSDDVIGDLNERIPRRLGVIVLLSVWVALLRANWWITLHEVTISAITLFLLVLYFWLVRRRRRIAQALNRRTGLTAFEVGPKFSRDLTKITLGRPLRFAAPWLVLLTLAIFLASGFRDLPYPRVLASAITILWIVFGIWAAGQIHGLPRSTIATLRFNVGLFGALFLVSITPSTPIIGVLRFLTSAPIIMSVAAAWVFVGTFFVAVPGEILRLPVASLVILFAIIASVMGCSDNHIVRVVEGSPPPDPTPLNQAFDLWWKDVPKPTKPTEPVPLVLVATAGGASRAAYWTTKVLSQIEQDHPGFHKHIFAISSVSGGSLGAVVYRTMLNDVINDNNSNGNIWWCTGKATRKNLVDCGLETIDNDFLGPTFLTGFYADLTQRFLPGSLLPDRAGALERSWEQAWQTTMPQSSKGVGLDAPFHSLWTGKTWLPALIINGTSEKTGRRIITSNLLIEPDRFTDAIDYFTRVSPISDIPVSTAAHNSARFPYIDAAGTLITAHVGMTDRIVDGGYFENFGAGSIYDLLRALNSPEIKGDKKIKFFVIQITSDPELEAQQAQRDISWERKSPFGLNVASDITAPPVALFDTGSALGFRATEVLKSFVNSIQMERAPHYTQFRLTNADETLSWVLSRKSIGSLNSEWNNNAGPYEELRAFMNWN